MQKKLFKVLALVLALLMIVPMVVACGGTKDDNKKDNNNEEKGNGTDTSVSTEENPDPVPPQDLGGRVFKIAAADWSAYKPLDFIDLETEEYNGDFVNDAAHDRNLYMQEKFNCTVRQIDYKSSDLSTKLQQNAMAGDDAFDFVMFRGTNYMASVNAGQLSEITPFNLDFNNTWWDSNAIASMTINNKTFGVIGDVTTNHLLATSMTCFNKTLIEANKFDSPYELVDSGNWTWENMYTMSTAYADDSDGVVGMGADDQWGTHYTVDTVTGLLVACGVKFVTKSANGELKVTISDYQSDIQEIFKGLFDDTHATETIGGPILKAKDADTEFFDKGKVLFILTATHNSGALRKSEVDYGIVPYPKLNAGTDTNYIPNTAGNYLSIMGIPLTNVDYETSRVFLEAYAAQGQKKVRPQFYENVLLRKVGRDVESFGMLKFIYENLTYDIGIIFNIGRSEIGKACTTRDTNVSSMIGGSRIKWRSELENLIFAYSDDKPAA